MAGDQAQSEAVVIVNPNAGKLNQRDRQAVVDALRRKLPVEVVWSPLRDAGVTLAREAAEAGTRVVIAFGGDGHVNEVANGVARSGASLGIIPGGTMNVFSRTMGIPLDPYRAVDHLVDALDRDHRVVPLGRTNERYFTFSAGCGFDAEAAERVERLTANKRRFGEAFFYWSAFRVLADSFRRRDPTMTLSGDFGEVPVAMAIACNVGPYAYLGSRPVNLAPEVQLDSGVDVFAMKNMRLGALPLYVWRVAVSGDLVHHRDAFYASDLTWFEVRSAEPFSRHVDGEPLPPTTRARFSIAPNALSVVT
jgi:diacylglycerol kinase family enzyme